jgi:hypothetical protein
MVEQVDGVKCLGAVPDADDPARGRRAELMRRALRALLGEGRIAVREGLSSNLGRECDPGEVGRIFDRPVTGRSSRAGLGKPLRAAPNVLAGASH